MVAKPRKVGSNSDCKRGAGKNDPTLATRSLHDPLAALAFAVGQEDMFVGAGDPLGFELILNLFEFFVEKTELLVDGVTAFDELREVDFGF